MRRIAGLLLISILFATGCSSKPEKEAVVVYTSQDQVYAEPLFKEFTAATGIEVKALYDSESAKTAGLAHRLRLEKDNPQCDLFWNNEEFHSRMLARDDVVKPPKEFGYRLRRLVINTNLVPMDRVPRTLMELTNSVWAGKFALSYPLFGTTGLHFLALRQQWGEERWKWWCHRIIQNNAKVVDGNSMVVRLVGAGEAYIGLTDSDDIRAGKKQGFPIAEIPIPLESLAIANTIALVKNAPHGGAAELLADFLTKPETVAKLVKEGALDGQTPGPQESAISINWKDSLREFQDAANFLRIVFVRS